MSSPKQKLHTICFILLFALLCVIYFHEQLFLGPSLIHAWAQGDRYSLAINFYDNGMNFFLPATSNLNSENGITGVEFPIQAYLAAALGHIMGREHISMCFKLITILISCMGLSALFLTVYKRTKDIIFSSLTPLLIFCSPVFIYYTCNYLPDTAGASFAFMSFYYVTDSIETNTRKSYYTALFLLTLGTLIKTSTGIYLLGFMAASFLYRAFGKERKPLRNNIAFYLSSILFLLPIITYYKYNTWLTEKYGASIFMMKAMPFENWEMFKNYATGIFKDRWMYDYLSWPVYFICFVIVPTGIFLLRKSSIGRKQILLLAIYFVGVLSGLYLMGAQLGVHDYYFIPIAIPFIAYSVMVSVIRIYQKGFILSSLRYTFILALSISLFTGYNRFKKRADEPTDLYQWSVNGAKTLDEVGVSRKEPVLLVNEYASNLPLTYLDRRGYDIYFYKLDSAIWYIVDRLESLQVQVIVLRAETEQKFKANNPDAFKQFSHLVTKDELAVYRYNTP